MYEDHDAVGSVKAYIQVYSPYVYPNSAFLDVTTSWVMLFNTRASNYIQVGWLEEEGNKRFNFAEYGYNNSADGYYDTYAGPSIIGHQPLYNVRYNPDKNEFTTLINGSVLTTLDNPGLGVPNEAQIYSEIHEHASQVPGTDKIPEAVTNLSVGYPPGGSGTVHAGRATTANALSYARVSPSAGTSGTDALTSWDTGCND